MSVFSMDRFFAFDRNLAKSATGTRKPFFALCLGAVLLSGCTTGSTEDPPIINPKPTAEVKATPMEPVAPQPTPDFSEWVKGLRAEALSKGISAKILDEALNDIYPIRRVIELDRNQPEFKLTYNEYMNRVVPVSRVEKARAKFAENRELLEEVSKKYGVQPQFLVAFWGVETDFGRTTGSFPIVKSLATLAHDGRRSAFFRKQLLYALEILNAGHAHPSNFRGSWAGAMGQCQFMPSTFVNYAVDGDGDGRIDLWNSKKDVFSSAANYLSKSGWKDQENWGVAVELPKNFDRKLADGTRYSMKTWAALGVTDATGKPLPQTETNAALIFAEKDQGPAFLVFNNYFTTLKWNRSTFYALAVGQLADAIVKG